MCGHTYMCAVDNSRIFTVNIWAMGLLFHLETNKLTASKQQLPQPGVCVGPCATPRFPHKFSCLLAGKRLGAHWHLHTRGCVTSRSNTPWATLTDTSTSALLTRCYCSAKKCIYSFIFLDCLNGSSPHVQMLHVCTDCFYGTWICTLTVATCHRCNQRS